MHADESWPVLVTGCSSGIGIGMATALRLASAGYPVVATVRAPASAGTLRQRAGAAGVSLDIRPLDVTDDAAARTCIDAVVAEYGGLWALVNNAGTAHLAVFEFEPMAAFRRVVEVNLFGAVRMTKLALPHLCASHGRLLAISSVGGAVGQPFNEAYCAAKFAIEGVYETLAPVVRQLGVAVSILEPGPVATNLTSRIDVPGILAAAGPYQRLLARFLATGSHPELDHPFRDGQTAEEIAGLVQEILEDASPRFRYPASPNARHFIAHKLADLDGDAVQRLFDSWLTATGPGEHD